MNHTDRIAALGVALYGPRWHRAVARDLGISHRQIMRWVHEGYEPSQAHVDALAAKARHQIKVIEVALRSA